MICVATFAQPNNTELPDPAPGDQTAWTKLNSVTLSWGNIDTRYSKSQIPTNISKTLSLTGWRGERVAAQAVLSTPLDLSNVSFTVSDLKSNKCTIPASSIKRYFVRYVLTDEFERKESKNSKFH